MPGSKRKERISSSASVGIAVVKRKGVASMWFRTHHGRYSYKIKQGGRGNRCRAKQFLDDQIGARKGLIARRC